MRSRNALICTRIGRSLLVLSSSSAALIRRASSLCASSSTPTSCFFNSACFTFLLNASSSSHLFMSCLTTLFTTSPSTLLPSRSHLAIYAAKSRCRSSSFLPLSFCPFAIHASAASRYAPALSKSLAAGTLSPIPAIIFAASLGSPAALCARHDAAVLPSRATRHAAAALRRPSFRCARPLGALAFPSGRCATVAIMFASASCAKPSYPLPAL
mmetsp:Transcript_86857/g.246082  ORF Transcript_86857/g.246082 Transcript_86857/m.246082 type:complete len:213 (-) Transcript_86857:173-811(-)